MTKDIIYYMDDGTPFTHAIMVKQLAKSPELILEQLGENLKALDAWHAATGIAGEAGELLDAIKKYAVYAKPIDRENVVEELGDLKFYMQQLMNNLGITWGEVETYNVNKLVLKDNARYKGMMYSDAAAKARADKELQNVSDGARGPGKTGAHYKKVTGQYLPEDRALLDSLVEIKPEDKA